MDTLADAVNILVAEDPSGQALRVLARIVVDAGSRGAAVLVPTGDRLDVFAARGTSFEGMERARTWWLKRDEWIGDEHHEQDDALYQLGEQKPVGLLYLEGGAASREAIAHLLFVLTAAVSVAARTTSPDPLRLVETHVVESEEKRFRRTLQDTEYNLSQASRRLHVSRRTVYQRMKKYGIKRPDRGRRGAALQQKAG